MREGEDVITEKTPIKRLLIALREQAEWARLNDRSCPITLTERLTAAADLIEDQQKQIAALRNELCQLCGKYR